MPEETWSPDLADGSSLQQFLTQVAVISLDKNAEGAGKIKAGKNITFFERELQVLTWEGTLQNFYNTIWHNRFWLILLN